MTDPTPGDGVRPLAAPHRTIHMVGNSHLDLVWLWPWQEAYQEARATFRSALDRMDEYPDFVFTCDQVVLLAWVEEQDPALFDRIREREAEGRWVNAGGWWVEPDCNLPSGESLARQGLWGQRFLRSRFGRGARVGMNVDPFGHAATIPAILDQQGIDSYCFLRPMAHEKPLPANLFRWAAPDGTQVLAFRIPYEYQTAFGSVDRHVEKALAELDESADDVMIFFGVGNHGGGPTKAEIDTVHRFDAMGSFGRLELSTPQRYFDAAVTDGLPVVTGDLQHHSPGCYSALSSMKIAVRRAESALLVAERWAVVLAFTEGRPYPRAELEQGWKQLLLNEFHDLLPGTAIQAGYDDAGDQLGEATAIAKRITARSQNVLASRIGIPLDPATQPVVVFNPHPWPVRADVELHLGVGRDVDPHRVDDGTGARVLSQPIASRSQVGRSVGSAIAFTADLPPLGHRVYTLHRGRPSGAPPLPPIASADGLVLENDLLRAELDPTTGWLASLTDKRTGAQLAGRGPHTVISADGTDTWGHRVVSYVLPGEPMRLDRIRVRENGALRAGMRIERSWGRSSLVEEVFLGRDADHLEVRVELDWRERAHLLKLRFPVAVAGPVATTEIPYGSIERPIDGAEQPSRSWVDLSGADRGLALVNDAKHGVDFSPAVDGLDASIGLTAVRSPVFTWHDPTPLDPDGVYAYQDQGLQRWSYLLVPHAGDRTGLHRRAEQLTIRPRAMLESFHDGPAPASRSFVSVEGDAVLVTAVKGSEDDPLDLVVRAVETTGREAPVRIDVPLLGRMIEDVLPPFALRSWRVPADPARPIQVVDLLEEPQA